MKTRLVNLSDFAGHSHPASKLFRAIELRTIYKNTQNLNFKHPALDLGCGDGYLSSILFDEKFDYGLDNDEAGEVSLAIKNKRYKKVLIENAEKISLPSNSLHFIFSNSVIEHIPNLENVLREISRVLKKGGVFVFTSPSDKFKEYLYFSNILSSFGLDFLGDWYKEKRNKLLNHYHNYSHTSWIKKLNKHGLKVKKYDYCICRDTNMFWDKLALEVRLRVLIDNNSEKNIFKKYKEKINNYLINDKVRDNKGASLFILAVKN